MGGVIESVFGSTQQQGQTSGINLRKEDEAAIRAQQQQFQQQTGNFQNLANRLQGQALGSAPQLQTGFQRSAGLNTQFNQPQFQNGLDATSQALLSQAQQQQNNQLGVQQRQIAQQFRNNPAVAQILSQQVASQNALAQNPLQFQAQQAQDVRQIQRADALNQALGLGNQARLAEAQFGQGALQNINQALLQQQQSGAAARGEASGYGGQSLAASQAALQQLMGLGQLFGQQYGQSLAQRGGLFGGSGFLGIGI